jgi:hypothetical protein
LKGIKSANLTKSMGRRRSAGVNITRRIRTSLAARERLDRLERPRLILLHCLIPSDDSLGLYIEPG